MPGPDRSDALVIGAGFSGLAAGIRLAQLGRSVAVLERHYLVGGLNSYYKLAGRRFDVGLHALTNYAAARTRGAPLVRLLRQLRLRHEDLELGEQGFSTIHFPGVELRFSNDLALLAAEVERAFPRERDAFDAFLADVRAYDLDRAPADERSARRLLLERFREPLLAEMLLLPVLFYGSPREDDLDWASYAVLFRSIFLEGLARPAGGIKPLLDLLVARLKDAGGELCLRAGVRSIRLEGGRAAGVVLDDGRELAADLILSSAGWPATARLCGRSVPAAEVGQLSFLESVSILDRAPCELGHGAATTFYCSEPRALYRVPTTDVEVRAGVISAPNNFASAEPLPEGILRLTVAANPARWAALSPEDYRRAKERAADAAIGAAAAFVPDWRPHTVFRDVFTPRTIERFTGHQNGAVYGSPAKRRDGRTGVERLILCGSDQGYVGVVGALISGITMANQAVRLYPDPLSSSPGPRA
jgi:phytoene dehydrogenase-like protein